MHVLNGYSRSRLDAGFENFTPFNGNNGWRGSTSINVSEPERIASLVGGGALTILGLAMAVSRRQVGGLILSLVGGELLWTGITGNSPIHTMLNKNSAVTGLSRLVSVPHEQGYKLERAITINKSPKELYQFWRNLDNLPRFMEHLDSVEVLDDRRSHWVAKAPAGMKVEWDAEIINEVENERIGWRSLEGSQINNAGSVQFKPAPDGRGTEVDVTLKYDPPAGALGAAFAKLFGEEPEQQIREDLRRLKQLMETGEIPTNDNQPSGRPWDKQLKKEMVE
jgi:uncharacterized membrane protein